jgi:phosphinothricin acetyltransferase
MQLRLATPADAAQIAEIYAPAVTDSHISFEEIAPDAAEIAARITTGLQTYPWLVFEDGGRVLGFAYAGRHQARASYRWSADVTVYIRKGYHRHGIGRLLYDELFAILRRQGFRMVFAGIALPNEASVGLHSAMGFKLVGVYPNVGFKRDGWRDVAWWALDLGDPGAGGPPIDPIPLKELLRQQGDV